MRSRFYTHLLVLIPLLSTALLACSSGEETEPSPWMQQQALVTDPPTTGSVASGVYRNLFVEWLGVSQADVDAKLDALWAHYFDGGATAKLYYADGSNANGPKAYIYDTGNRDIRSEGMGYGMMIAVQMDKKSYFDAIWNWAKTNMQYQSGDWDGYFAWECDRQGNKVGTTPASDGEEYIATSLFFAAHRWGNGSGIYDYEAEANRILDTMLHKEDMNGGVVNGVTNMFDAATHEVVFVPYYSSATHTDPSYQLPAFYSLWALWAQGYQGQQAADRQFWSDAAATSRAFFGWTTNPSTGLNPDYAYFTGEPHPDYQGDPTHEDFRYDAWRTSVNWSVDYAWWAADSNETALSDKLLSFFYGQGLTTYGSLFTLDGTALDTSHALGLVASNGAAALAATSTPSAHAEAFVQELWNTDPKFGNYRYYDGMLQFLAFLHVSGQFRAIMPASPDVCGDGTCGPTENSCTCSADCGTPAAEVCTGGIDEDCDGLIDCADPDCSAAPACQTTCVSNRGACSTNADCCSNNCRGGSCKGG